MHSKAENILRKYYSGHEEAYSYLHTHSLFVARLALKVAEHNPLISVDSKQLALAAMLHDIGIIMTDAPGIGCFGKYPYLAHGYLGREILEKEGLFELAPVCERHVGVGITLQDIQENNLPLPAREMVPVSHIERIVCYADKFYSKKPKYLTQPKPIEKILNSLLKHGPAKPAIFQEMMDTFGWEYIYE